MDTLCCKCGQVYTDVRLECECGSHNVEHLQPPEAPKPTGEAALAPVLCYVEWEPESNKPAIFFSVLVYGVLEGESEPDTHEGYWCGASWWSVRSDEESGDWMPLSNVTHWARRPTPHNEKMKHSG